MHEEHSSPAHAPALKKIDLTIARLRLLLADLTAREAASQDQQRQCREQHHKLVTFSLYGDSSLDSVLAMMSDVQERMASIEAKSRSLVDIRRRAENELESLQLTKDIEEAKVLLRQLQARQAAPVEPADTQSAAQIQAEITRLRSLINEFSERAAKNIERSSRR